MRKPCRNVAVLLAMLAVGPLFAGASQAELENLLRHGFWHPDVEPDVPPPYVPLRYRNSLPEFQWFFGKSGWTTNQLIEGLICAITNNVVDEKWTDMGKQRIATVATRKLSEIDDPAVTNFFRVFNDSYDTPRLKVFTIPSMFRRTNLEPEVMTYMRDQCLRTNSYFNAQALVMRDMFETLSTMPDQLKLAATNRVAKYMYFAIGHTTRFIAWQDEELSRFIPAYSNSFQRLSLMKYVSTSATNTWERTNAAQVVQRLESLPTNQLNNISWIAEDVTGGK